MQILFYLLSHQNKRELSLTDLTKLLNRSKTTVHHHVQALEKSGILIGRTEKTKNYKVKFYIVKPEIASLFSSSSQINLHINHNNQSQQQEAFYYIKAFSAFFYSILERYATFINNITSVTNLGLMKGAVVFCLTDEPGSKQLLQQITESLNSIPNITNKLQPNADSWAFMMAVVPYGKMIDIDLQKGL